MLIQLISWENHRCNWPPIRVRTLERIVFSNKINEIENLNSLKSAGFEKITDLLVKNGAKVNDADVSGKTALHQAASFGNNCIC